MSGTLATELRDALITLLSPLTAAATPEGAVALLQSIGHVGATAADPGLRAELQRIAELTAGLADLDEDELQTWAGLERLLELGRGLMDAVRGAEAALSDPALAAQAEQLGADLAERLVALYLRDAHPRLFRSASLLGLITPGDRADPQPMVVEADGALRRLPWSRDALHPDRLGDLIGDPAGFLSALYLPGGMQAAADAHAAAAALFPLVADLARTLGLRVGTDLERVVPQPPPPAEGDDGDLSPWPPPEDDDPAPDLGPLDPTDFQRGYRPRLAFELAPLSTDPSAPARLGVALVASAAEHPDHVRGYLVLLFGAAGWTEDRGSWRVALGSDGDLPAVSVGPGGVLLGPGQAPGTTLTATLSAERIAEAGAPAFVVGGADASRLEIGTLKVSAGLALSEARRAVDVALDAGSAVLVLAGGDDGFLGALLPSDGLRVPFGLGLVLSSDRGVWLRGGQGLQLPIPTRLTVGSVSIDEIRIVVSAGQDGVHLDAGSTISADFGPITAVVEGLGLRVTVGSAPDGGALGPVDVSAGFLPPLGVGLGIEAGVLAGGGFIRYDPTVGRYSGAFELQAGRVGIGALGVLDARLPGGAPGFALLVALRATFPAIQVGLGFALTSVGGLLALNRRVDVDALRAQIATGIAGRILAPEDPIRNAPALLADLGTVFPIARGVTVVGPTVQLVWARLVRFDIGVFIELPGPSKIVVLGSARAAIESGGRAYLVIRVDIVGVVDLQQRTAAFDAVLIESQLLEILELTGGAAFRLSWGEQPYAVLTLGGFHPAYNPEPLVFPSSLTRVAMVHGTPQDRLYLRFEGYFAVTSNTLQLGAAVEAIIRSGNFNIQGILGFDALIRFEPFHFQIDIRASVRVRYKSRSLGGLTLTGSLEGPGPIVLRAKVCIELLFFDICFSGTFTLGSSTPPPVTTIASALGVLVAELDDPATLHASEAADRLVTLRPPPQGSRPIVSPVGQLVWVQRRAPLALLLQRIGQSPLASPESVEATSADGATPELDWFAPGSFANLTDDQALTRRGFERLSGGLRFGADGVTDGPSQQRTLNIRQIRLPAKAQTTRTPVAFPSWVLAAASRARGSGAGQEPVVGAITVMEESWTVVDLTTGQRRDGLAAAQAQQLAALAPAMAGRVAVPGGDRLPNLVF